MTLKYKYCQCVVRVVNACHFRGHFTFHRPVIFAPPSHVLKIALGLLILFVSLMNQTTFFGWRLSVRDYKCPSAYNL